MPPTPTERIIKAEVLVDAIREDIREIRSQVDDMEKALHGLESSQAVQSSQLERLLVSADKLQQAAKQINTHSLDQSIEQASSFFTAARIKQLIGVGIAVVTVVWGIYQGALELAKPSQSLLDREGHQSQQQAP